MGLFGSGFYAGQAVNSARADAAGASSKVTLSDLNTRIKSIDRRLGYNYKAVTLWGDVVAAKSDVSAICRAVDASC